MNGGISAANGYSLDFLCFSIVKNYEEDRGREEVEQNRTECSPSSLSQSQEQ